MVFRLKTFSAWLWAVVAGCFLAGCAGTLPPQLFSPDESVRRSAYLDVARMPRPAKAGVVSALRKKLKSRDADVRERAVLALGHAGPVDIGVVRDVIPLLDDPEKRVRRATVEALPGMGPEALTGLIAALRADDAAVRDKAVEAVSLFWTLTPATMPALTGLLKDSKEAARHSGLRVLTNLGPRARRAVPDITWLLTEPDQQTRLMALQALVSIGGEQVNETLVRAVQDPHPDIRSEAIKNIDRLKVDTPALRSLLVMYSDDEAENVAVNALRALGRMKNLEVETLDSIGRAFKDPRARVHDEAGKALAAQGRAALPALSNIMREESGDVEARARRLAAQIRTESSAPKRPAAPAPAASGGVEKILKTAPADVCEDKSPCP